MGSPWNDSFDESKEAIGKRQDWNYLVITQMPIMHPNISGYLGVMEFETTAAVN
jgi:hypothetical protein